MTLEFDKVDLLAFASMMKQLRELPCYELAADSVRVRMCRSCSDDVLDCVANFAMMHLRRGWAPEAPPHEDALEKELQDLRY